MVTCCHQVLICDHGIVAAVSPCWRSGSGVPHAFAASVPSGWDCGKQPEKTRLSPVGGARSRHHQLRLSSRRRWLRDRLRSRLQGKKAVMVHTHQGYEHHARERVRVSDDLLPRPGFKSAAVYFEWLAQKETRDYDRQQRLLEVAGFYLSLTRLIPYSPSAS